MKTKNILIGIAIGIGAFVIYKKFIKKEELKFGVTGQGDTKKKGCPCYGVQTADGKLLYKDACCKKAQSMVSTPLGGSKVGI